MLFFIDPKLGFYINSFTMISYSRPMRFNDNNLMRYDLTHFNVFYRSTVLIMLFRVTICVFRRVYNCSLIIVLSAHNEIRVDRLILKNYNNVHGFLYIAYILLLFKIPKMIYLAWPRQFEFHCPSLFS